MSEAHHTTTPIGGGEGSLLRFSSEAPQFTLAYSPPSELTRNPDDIIRLQDELGQSALELSRRDTEIQELQAHVAYLEARQARATEPLQQVGRTAVREEVAVNPSTNGVHHEVEIRVKPSQNGNSSMAETKPAIDLTPDPSLSPSQQRFEQAILYLLGTPGLAIRRPDAGGFLKRELGIRQITDWSNMRGKLEELGIITITKPSPQARRSIGISLNVEGVVACIDKPFITPRILSVLREANLSADGSVEEQPATSQDVQPNANANGNGNTNGHHQPLAMSPRTRKMLEREPDPLPGYRTRGKKSRDTGPFLEHRRETRGAKQR